MRPHRGSACAADGHEIQVADGRAIDVPTSWTSFPEDGRVMNRFPDKLLVERRFWKRNELWLDLGRHIASIVCHEDRLQGSICYSRTENSQNKPEVVDAVIQDFGVDCAARSIHFTEFWPDWKMQKRLGELSWTAKK